MHVQEGDRVRLGQPLFSDRRRAGRDGDGAGHGRRDADPRGVPGVLQSVIITLDGDDEVTFDHWAPANCRPWIVTSSSRT
jgi:Na+-transporting NADH:ubiquinone oxidoreductase subunit A